MKKIIFLLLLFITQHSYSQFQVNSESYSESEYKLEIQIEPEKFSIIKTGNNKTIHFDKSTMDESKPGAFILPQKEIFIAIPCNSDPEIKLNIIKSEIIKAVPELNPIINLDIKNNSIQYSQVTEYKENLDNSFLKLKVFFGLTITTVLTFQLIIFYMISLTEM